MEKIMGDKDIAVATYKAGDKKIKTALETIFGAKFFQPITERLLTWEDAAEEYGIDPVESLPYKNPANNRQEAANAFFQLDVISELLCEGVVLDWTNSSQQKWYPWFNEYKAGSGFRFHVSDDGWSATAAVGGARLCVPTKSLSDFFGKQFLPIWNKFLNPTK